jgi:hypothetical protein
MEARDRAELKRRVKMLLLGQRSLEPIGLWGDETAGRK